MGEKTPSGQGLAELEASLPNLGQQSVHDAHLFYNGGSRLLRVSGLAGRARRLETLGAFLVSSSLLVLLLRQLDLLAKVVEDVEALLDRKPVLVFAEVLR